MRSVSYQRQVGDQFLPELLVICMIRGSCSGGFEYCPLGCNDMYCGESQPTFRGNMPPWFPKPKCKPSKKCAWSREQAELAVDFSRSMEHYISEDRTRNCIVGLHTRNVVEFDNHVNSFKLFCTYYRVSKPICISHITLCILWCPHYTPLPKQKNRRIGLIQSRLFT
jgi:hypothetical protein